MRGESSNSQAGPASTTDRESYSDRKRRLERESAQNQPKNLVAAAEEHTFEAGDMQPLPHAPHPLLLDSELPAVLPHLLLASQQPGLPFPLASPWLLLLLLLLSQLWT